MFSGFPFVLQRVPSQQIADIDFEHLDATAYKLENGLKRLIESLQKKQLTDTWEDTFIIREDEARYIVKNKGSTKGKAKTKSKRKRNG